MRSSSVRPAAERRAKRAGGPRAQAANTATVASPVHQRGAALIRRGEQGIWAALLSLALAFALAAVLGVPSPLEPITELIVRLTPVDAATLLINVLGPLTPAFALLGALALTIPAAVALALVAPGNLTAEGQEGVNKEDTEDAEEEGGRCREEDAANVGPIRDRGSERISSAASEDAARHARDVPAKRERRLRQLASSRVHAVALRWAAVAALALLLMLPLARAANELVAAVCTLLAGALYTPALLLVRALQRRHRGSQHGVVGREVSRRAFVRTAAATSARVGGFLALSSFDLWAKALGGALGRGEVLRRLFAFVSPGPRAAGFPVPGEEPEVTPAMRFYRMSKNNLDPELSAETWALRLDGAVTHPLTLRYADLLALPRVDQYVTLRCVSNPVGGHLMSTAYFSGVPLSRLLAMAGSQPGTAGVLFAAPDAYDEVVPLDVALDPTALVAYGMNGETLARVHGGPARGLLPGYYGFKNVKWLTRITVLRRLDPGYWERSGWTAARVHSVARIDVWRPEPGGLLCAGVAFTGTRGISAVQVRADSGPWQEADLNAPTLSGMTWVQWRAHLALGAGTHTLAVRVVDAAGQPQSMHAKAIYPDGAQGLHSVSVTI